MKKSIYILFLLFVVSVIQAQTLFEKGFYVDNIGNKVEGLIKNIDWKNNPTEFEFKYNENEESQIISINNAKEFVVDGKSKYIRAKVDIDRSSSITKDLSNNKLPVFKNETLFLKNIVEGKANLFLYEDNNLVRFFFSTDQLPIEQLVYKPFLITNDKVSYNIAYKQQILNNLKCDKITLRQIENLDYFSKDLISIFLEYNKCILGSDYINHSESSVKRKKININLRLGVSLNNISLNNSLNGFTTEFNKTIGFRIGSELEFVLPFNNNKWAILTEPTFNTFSSDSKNALTTTSVKYSSIDLGVGIRHYFFLPDKSKFYGNFSYNYAILTSGSIDFSNYASELDISGNGNFSLGIGYKRNKFSIEIVQSFNRSIISNYAFWGSDFSSTSLIVGYTIF